MTDFAAINPYSPNYGTNITPEQYQQYLQNLNTSIEVGSNYPQRALYGGINPVDASINRGAEGLPGPAPLPVNLGAQVPRPSFSTTPDTIGLPQTGMQNPNQQLPGLLQPQQPGNPQGGMLQNGPQAGGRYNDLAQMLARGRVGGNAGGLMPPSGPIGPIGGP